MSSTMRVWPRLVHAGRAARRAVPAGSHSQALLATVTASLMSGAVAAVSKIVLVEMPPFSSVFLRFALASLLLLPLVLRSGYRLHGAGVRLLAVSGLSVANALFFILGIQLTTASSGQMLYTGVPILTALAGVLWLRQSLTVRKLSYMSIGLLGALLVIALPVLEGDDRASGSLEGNLLISLGVIAWALYLTGSRPLHRHYGPLVLTTTFVVLSAIVFLPLALAEVHARPQWWIGVSAYGVVGLIYLTLFGTVANYVLIQYAIRHGGPHVASLSLYLIPIFAYAVAHVLLGELPSPGLLLGTGLVFLSVGAIMYRR